MNTFTIQKSYRSVAGLDTWEKFNKANESTSLLQSDKWIRYLETAGVPFYRLVATYQSETIAQLLVWLEAPAKFSIFKMPRSWIRLIGRLTPRICWQGGPIFKKNSPFLKEEILTAFVEKLGKKNILQGVSACERSDRNFENLEQKGFSAYHTFLIDLQASEEAKWENLHKSVKKNLRKNTGLTIKTLNLSEFREYQILLNRFRKAIHQPTLTLGGSDKFYQEIKKTAFFEHVGAYQGNALVSAMGLYGYGEVLTEIGIARDLTNPQGSLAQDFIKWHVIKNGRNWGFRLYDLAGFEPDNPTEKAQNIRRYKEKWGGRAVSFWQFKN